ncbi:MAG: FAD-dependent oxidoreductase [Terrimicrobiaceae bacterium]
MKSSDEGVHDVVVAGATPAGISAAIAAARRGLAVALVDPLPVPGQMLSNGLCVFDTAHRAGVTGIMSEFAARVAAHHREHYASDPAVAENRGAPRHGAADGLSFEPKVAARILWEMIQDTAGLSYFPRHAFTGALMEGKRCAGVIARPIRGEKFDPLSVFPLAEPGAEHIEFRGRAVIDATYEGDIAAWAGAAFRSGRDGRSREEPHNGVIMSDYHKGRMSVEAGWLPETFLAGSTGEADPKVMGANVRFVIKNHGCAEGPHRIEKPENYDPARYRNGWRPTVWTYIPGGKWFVNIMNGGNDLQGDLLASYPGGSPAQRRKVLAAIYERAREYLYHIQTARGCPEWGLADDEFPLSGGWPYCVYVREARRIAGQSHLTETDIHRWMPRDGENFLTGLTGDHSRPRLQPDSVAVGDYDLDCHPCDDEPSEEYQSSGEGGFMFSSLRSPIQVPYGCMVPRGIEGLLVTCAISVSHVAMAVVRMEPVWAQLGHAAGIAAALSCETKASFQELDVRAVQEQLLRDGCQLYYYTDLPPSHPAFAAAQRLSLRGVMSGFPDWTFRPERLLTRGEWARMLAAAFDLWPSVTANHFDDVPPEHPAFPAFETLYDYGARAGIPVVKFERHQKVWSDDTLGYRFFARPDDDIPSREASEMAEALARAMGRRTAGTRIGEEGEFLSRAEAAVLLDGVAPGRRARAAGELMLSNNCFACFGL